MQDLLSMPLGRLLLMPMENERRFDRNGEERSFILSRDQSFPSYWKSVGESDG